MICELCRHIVRWYGQVNSRDEEVALLLLLLVVELVRISKAELPLDLQSVDAKPFLAKGLPFMARYSKLIKLVC